MKDLSIGYRQRTEEEFRQLWKDGIFIFDANILLNIYRYSVKAQESLFSILKQFQSRIWLPHQAAREYQKNRQVVIDGEANKYDKLENKIVKLLQDFENETNHYQRHISIERNKIIGLIKNGIEKSLKKLEESKKNHPDSVVFENLNKEIDELFAGKVGEEYEDEVLIEKFRKAALRFQLQKPPGYKDAKGKQGNDRYGDVILWYQVIDYAKKIKKPIILITDDRKEDWWLKEKGETISPRPELIIEINDIAKVDFYMYQSDGFIKYAQEFLKLEAQEDVIKEIQDLREQDSIADGFLYRENLDPRLLEIVRQNHPAGITISEALAIENNFNNRNNNINSAVRQMMGMPPYYNPVQNIYEKRYANVIANQQLTAMRDYFDNSNSHPLRGQSISRTPFISVTPLKKKDLQDGELNPTVRVNVYESEENETKTVIEVTDYFDDDENISTTSYEFDKFPSAIKIIHRKNRPDTYETGHRLEGPSPDEWYKWGREIYLSIHYLSDEESKEAGIKDEEKDKDWLNSLYYEFEASNKLYDNKISEVAGILLDENDDFPEDKFRALDESVIEKIKFDVKELVITGLYECYCQKEINESETNGRTYISQELRENSRNFIIKHYLKQPDSAEVEYFCSNLIQGFFEKDEDGQEVVRLQLNLKVADDLYDKLIENIEGATVGGQQFSQKTKIEFIHEINPVYKLRILEPLLKVNAWYFKVDDIVI